MVFIPFEQMLFKIANFDVIKSISLFVYFLNHCNKKPLLLVIYINKNTILDCNNDFLTLFHR